MYASLHPACRARAIQRRAAGGERRAAGLEVDAVDKGGPATDFGSCSRWSGWLWTSQFSLQPAPRSWASVRQRSPSYARETKDWLAS